MTLVRPAERAWLRLVIFSLASFFTAFCTPGRADETGAASTALGARLYLKGLDAEGLQVRATIQDGAPLSGPRLGCVACHRASGFGSSEGGYYSPPINGPTLFSPRQLDRARFLANRFEQAQPQRYRIRLSQPHMRPAYTQETLARALRSGIDPAGQPLDPAMPRYDLKDADVTNLAAYLNDLSSQIDAGVTQEEIHFATFVSQDAPQRQRAAMISTIEAYFEWFNKISRGDRSRVGFSPYHRSETIGSSREWRLHIWELKGPPESWPEQLERFYTAQPVFAVVSGLVEGSFQPAAEFCEKKNLPVLFPNTELPATDLATPGHVFYFSRGVELEAQGFAAYLASLAEPPRAILQIVGPGPVANAAAAAFSRDMRTRLPSATIRQVDLRGEGLDEKPFDAVTTFADVILIWPGHAPDASLGSLIEQAPKTATILLPSDALEFAKTQLPADSIRHLKLAYPYEMPGVTHPLSYRVRAWMRTRGLEIDEPRLQFQTYFALSLLDAAMGRLLSDFHRDYLIETIEHEADGDLNPGVFPSLSLGPWQRFASKGVRIVRVDPTAEEGISGESDWIVP
jgi:ABC-type branched-subunit amino acid transport system substrate-binding protein